MEDILKWDREEVTKNFSSDLLRQYKLAGMLQLVFCNSPMEVLENAYPGEYDSKEMQATCMCRDDKILEKESIRLRKLCDGLSHEEIVKLYDNSFCVKNRFIAIMRGNAGDVSKFELLNKAFPDEFYEWEFTVPKGFWAIEKNRKRATLWLMEKEGTKALTTRQFSENGLSRILHYGKGLDNVTCEALGISQKQCREDFYKLFCQCNNTGIDLTKELGVDSSKLYAWRTRKTRPTFSFVLENYDKLVDISKQTENTPEGLYQKILEGKVSKFPSKYWKRENCYESAAKITRYAIEQVLQWSPVEVMTMLNTPVFRELKLDGMFYVLFQFDREQVIVNAYPEISWENKEFQLQCTRWLIDKTGKQVPSVKDFIHHKLRPIIKLADKDDLVREVYGIQNIDCLREMEKFRMQHCLTVEKFAAMTGINQATLYGGMNGSVSLSLNTEIKIMQTIRNQRNQDGNRYFLPVS